MRCILDECFFVALFTCAYRDSLAGTLRRALITFNGPGGGESQTGLSYSGIAMAFSGTFTSKIFYSIIRFIKNVDHVGCPSMISMICISIKI